MTSSRHPTLCVVACFYNMRRESARTLATLLPDYQRGVAKLDYEVIAVDNGSPEPLDGEAVERLGDGRCRYVFHATASASPAEAINAAVRQSSAEYVMCLIDGARMLSPGILHFGMLAARAFSQPFVYTLAMHLGPAPQNDSLLHGYDQAAEDALLATVDWKRNGYDLFGVSAVALSSRQGFFSEITESNCFLMRRDRYLAIGGFCEEFQSPGGGLVNLDFFNRINESSDIAPVMLLGEASFHQFHGGVATNVPRSQHPWNRFEEEYRRLRGRAFQSIVRPPVYIGEMRPECRGLARASLEAWSG